MKRIVVPRSSVRAGTVFVVDKDSRLRRRAVSILFSQGDISVIEEGLKQGERIVVSDLVPAVDGMLLEVEVDEALSKRLQAAGAGS